MIPPYLVELFKNQIYDPNSFFLIAGPCAIESEDLLNDVADKVSTICKRLKIPYIFKASYRKANRTSITSFTGLGDDIGLNLLQKISQTYQIPTTSDIHSHEEATIASQYIDVIQIPAFLCRQTDLLLAAAQTEKIVNIKKGQFVSGTAMKFAVEKLKQSGNNKIILTERGTMFGYADLIVDYRNIPIMKSFGVPVVVDCTHSLQQPNLISGVTGGHPEFIETIAKAAIASGADGIFLETHPNPGIAKSDGSNMLRLDLLENLLEKLVKIRKVINETT